MGDLLRLVLDSIQYLWPFRMVHWWEKGVYEFFGRWRVEVGPGVWPVIPWFIEVHTVDMQYEPIMTPRQDITLAEGEMLSFEAAATIRVVDAMKALTEVENYHDAAHKLLAGVLAEELALVDPERLSARKRSALFRSLATALNKESARYGIEYSDVRFASCVNNVRTYRILSSEIGGHW